MEKEKEKASIDFYKTAEGISKELRDDPDLKVYKDDGLSFDVKILRLSKDTPTNEKAIMDYVVKNKSAPAGKKKALFVYNGFDTNAKLIKTKAVVLKRTKSVLNANNLKLVN